MEYKARLVERLVADLRGCPQALGAWEGGSAANAASDQYSDIDLNVLATEPVGAIFETVQRTLESMGAIAHIWNQPKSIWVGVSQKIYFLEDAPAHFFVDVAAIPEGGEILGEVLQIERHGNPIVHFDRTGRLKGRPTDMAAILEKQRQRLGEIVGAFPVYRTEVFKELDRGHPIDAMAFYHSGMLRPLVELLGMRHRPAQFDFGLRYLHRAFPLELQREIEALLFVRDAAELREKATKLEGWFHRAAAEAEALLPEPDVILRAVTEADLPALFEFQTDPDANRMAAFTSKDPGDRAAFLTKWTRIAHDPATPYLAIVAGGRVVGSIVKWGAPGEAEISYWLGREHWGRGFATRALALFLERHVTERPIHARTAKDNVASLRVLAKCGFVVTGEERGFANARGAEIAELVLRLDRAPA